MCVRVHVALTDLFEIGFAVFMEKNKGLESSVFPPRLIRIELNPPNLHFPSFKDRWPQNGYVKKLQRKDGCFIYFDRTRECADKDVNKCKIYGY